MIRLEDPVNVLYGIGDVAATRLGRLEIFTVYDLISFLPFRYNDWSKVDTISSCEEGREISFYGTVSSAPSKQGYKASSPVSFFVSDGSGRIKLSFFNAPYILKKFERGDKCFVHGMVNSFGGKPQIVNPFIEKDETAAGMSLIRPVYHQTAGITSAQLSRWIKTALELVSDQLRDIVPETIVRSEGLPTAAESYRSVHFPGSLQEAALGRRRIAYEELILLGIGMKNFLQGEDKDDRAPIVVPSADKMTQEAKIRWKKVLGNLGFELTGDQKNALREIQTDLMVQRPMNRLVQGDVGSGKTAVAILSMAMTAIMGKQSVLLAPTSVLAKQHYDSARKLLEGSGINVVLLLGKTKASLKKEIKEQLRTNEASVIIGTHAVLSDDVSFNDLALVIADEQHRFGVKQREKLLISRQGDQDINSVHNLVMTATPIPRTLAMVIYGDMDTSVIKQKPAGRKEIKTNFLPATDSDDLYRALKAKLKNGEQVYIVCSRIDDESDGFMWDEVDDTESDVKDFVSVKTMAKRLQEHGVSGEFRTEMLYGSMKEKDKIDVMERFLAGETKILVSTTVIEVGVNNPNATLMVVMDAERFGLSTLHQLRGRIGRGDKQSYCILASNSRTEVALQRMKLMCECSDGFELAGKDLELRGPGDFFGTRQHGIPQLRAANLFTDAPVARTACDAVNDIFEKGGQEAAELYDSIKYMFDLRFRNKMENL